MDEVIGQIYKSQYNEAMSLLTKWYHWAKDPDILQGSHKTDCDIIKLYGDEGTPDHIVDPKCTCGFTEFWMKTKRLVESKCNPSTTPLSVNCRVVKTLEQAKQELKEVK